MSKKRLTIKDSTLKALLKNGGSKTAKKNFFELLKRATKTRK